MEPQDVIAIIKAVQAVEAKRRAETVAIIPPYGNLDEQIKYGRAAEPNQPTEQKVTLSNGVSYLVKAVSLHNNTTIVTPIEAGIE